MIDARAIRHVDAFTHVPLEGNPAAVVDGEELDAATMQRIALNQRLSETVFLLPPEDAANHVRIRIFTPQRELPFAGHPVIAAAHITIGEVRVKLREDEPLLLETGVGVIPVVVASTVDGPLYTMTQASPEFREPTASPQEIAHSVGLASENIVRVEDVSTGIFWPVAQVRSLDAMLKVQPDVAALMRWPFGLAVFCIGAQSRDAAVHVRVFAPAAGVFEDPVTGSANGCIGSPATACCPQSMALSSTSQSRAARWGSRAARTSA